MNLITHIPPFSFYQKFVVKNKVKFLRKVLSDHDEVDPKYSDSDDLDAAYAKGFNPS